MPQLQTTSQTLISVRVVVVTTLLVAALIIQLTAVPLFPIGFIYRIGGAAFLMTLGYIALERFIASRDVRISVQLMGDLLLETALVYFTGGWDSPFSSLYLVTIITASITLYRKGGLLAASGASILYGGLTDLMFYGVLPLPSSGFFADRTPPATGLYVTIGINLAGFYATAMLTSYISEKLKTTYEELHANRQNLAELQTLSRNVIESVPSGLITLSPAGQITFINPAGSEILKMPVQAIVGEQLSDIGLFWKDEWMELRASMLTDRIVRGETTFVRGGEIRSIGYAVTPLNTPEGKPYGLILIFQDLSEMKRLEAQLRMKDRMAAIGELSAGIAHEIRNPLAAIAGSVQVLKGSTSLSPQEDRLMSIILKESDRLNKTIADFLRFVRPQERAATNFDIAGALAETLELLANSSELTSAHRIERDIRPPSFQIVGDVNQIRQVFWNIARNAVQAMPDGGVLQVMAAAGESSYRIEFMDSGRGMSEEDVRRLFQPFRTNSPSGTGLGMAISYRIVQDHGGRISVDSAEGSGTTITVLLPVPGHSLEERERPVGARRQRRDEQRQQYGAR
jgi:two-component system, NtrC family, sensor histidine kinase PilS